MNYLALLNFQRIIFSILFILSGLYLIIFFLKEIIMLFIPQKKQTIDMYQLLANNISQQPQITIKKENLQPEKTIKKAITTPKVKIIGVKKERKSRKRKE